MGKLLHKPGVDFKDGLAPGGQFIYDTLKRLAAAYPFDLTVTSAYDGKHATNSKHYRGEALDIRSKDLSPARKAEVLADIQAALYVPPRRFWAILEHPGGPQEHFHVQVRAGLPPLQPSDLPKA